MIRSASTRSEKTCARPSRVAGFLTFLLCTICLFAVPATGQTVASTDDDLPVVEDQLTVSAHRVPLPLGTVGSRVSVITRDEIERRKYATLAELLRTVPGVTVVRNAGPGTQTSVFLRGAASANTLVLIDGLRVNSSTSGTFDFGDLSTTNIERIEILRGPQSTLYGSEATGGVISIVTRRGGTEREARIRAEAGSDAWQRFDASLSGGQGVFDYSVAGSFLDTDGISAVGGIDAEADSHRRSDASVRLGWKLGEAGRLDVTGRWLDSDLDIDGFGFFGPVDDPNAFQERDVTQAGASLEYAFAPRWTQRFSVGVVEEELLSDDPDNPFTFFLADTTTTRAMTQSEFEIDQNHSLVGGYVLEEREAEIDGAFSSFDADTQIESLYLQWLGRFDDVDLSLAVRSDSHDDFGDETTYRGTLSWLVATGARLHASAGSSFRAPSLNELFFPGFGNPDLDAETSFGWDLGIELIYLDDRLHVDVTYFAVDFTDLIGFDSSFQAINIDEAESRGIELMVDYDATETLDLQFSHTWNETEDLSTGLQLARRPEHKTTFAARWDALDDRLFVTGTVVLIRDRVDTGGADLDDYERVDATLEYRLTTIVAPYVRIENLFDQEYEEVNGFNTPGFRAYGGLELSF
ncbi:MAG: TonB-dependent receptor [Acidobacteriota bacterium]